MSKSISKIQGFDDEVLDGPKLFSKYKEASKSKPKLDKYLNYNTNSTYSYNIDDTVAINTR